MRDILDRYYTRDDVAQKLVSLLDLSEAESILEPSFGGGAFFRAFPNTAALFACDIDPASYLFSLLFNEKNKLADKYFCDFLQLDCSDIDLIVGNPPYGDAKRHCEHAIKNARKGVAFLLRLGFLASAQRSEFWKQNQPTRVIVLSKRPSFTGDGKTDGSEYAFFVWEKDKPRMPVEWI